MLYSEIIAVCSEKNAKHIKAPCGRNSEVLKVRLGGIYIYIVNTGFEGDNDLVEKTCLYSIRNCMDCLVKEGK